jgi:predicted RNase H-like nuclease
MVTHDAVLGVDGCPGGWVGALVAGSDVTWYDGPLATLLALPASVVAVDIPLGLPAGGARRACDLLAAQRLGAQRASVFPAPPRAVLDATGHADASLRSRAAGSVGVSIQTWNIVPKIREAALLRDDRLLEVHPELSFRALAGRPLPSKRSAAGRQARLAALRGWLPGLQLPAPRPGRAAVDDCLDALACAWTAARWRRGAAEVLGGDPDPTGQVMQIVV